MIKDKRDRTLAWETGPGEDRGREHDVRSTTAASRPRSIEDADELAEELARARRDGRDLAVVVLSAAPGRGESAPTSVRLQKPRVSRMLALLEAVAIREVLRRDDVVFYEAPKDRFVFSIAESDEKGVKRAVERIRLHLAGQLALRVRAGVARLESDGGTLEDLISVASERVPGSGSGPTTPIDSVLRGGTA